MIKERDRDRERDIKTERGEKLEKRGRERLESRRKNM
jgi:hypothetical protein